MASSALKHGFSLKDSLGILLSCVALSVSIFSLYYSNLRETNRVQVRFVDADWRRDGRYFARFAVVNSGNRSAIMVGAHFILSATPILKGKAGGGPVDPFAAVDSVETQFPIVLAAKELRLLDLPIPAHYLLAPPKPDSLAIHFVAFRFVSIDANGVWYDFISPSLMRLEIGPGSVLTRYLQVPQYAPIDLFSSDCRGSFGNEIGDRC